MFRMIRFLRIGLRDPDRAEDRRFIYLLNRAFTSGDPSDGLLYGTLTGVRCAESIASTCWLDPVQ